MNNKYYFFGIAFNADNDRWEIVTSLEPRIKSIRESLKMGFNVGKQHTRTAIAMCKVEDLEPRSSKGEKP